MMVTWCTRRIAIGDSTSTCHRQHTCKLYLKNEYCEVSALKSPTCKAALPAVVISNLSTRSFINLHTPQKSCEVLPVPNAAIGLSRSHTSAFCQPPVHTGYKRPARCFRPAHPSAWRLQQLTLSQAAAHPACLPVSVSAVHTLDVSFWQMC